MVCAMPRRRLSIFSLVFFVGFAALLVLPLRGQIFEMHGDFGSPDTYECVLSGLHGMGRDCGTKYNEMVFTAGILTVNPAPNDEFRLTLQPEAIFKGTPGAGMEIITAQRKCLPAMRVGDSWLFSLYRDPASKALIVNYGSRSGPVAQEGEDIALLRRLASLDHDGIVKGDASWDRETMEHWQEHSELKNHAIFLTRVEDGRKLKAVTDSEGKFEFEPLLAGKYDLEPNTKPGLWTMWSGKIDVEAHSCTYFDLDFQVDGEIAGRLVFPAGVDPNTWQIEVSPVNDPGVVAASTWTDESGHFVLHGLNPGNYLVKFEKTEMREGPNLRVDLYAPGTPDRSNAQVIELGKAARVEGIEIVVPRNELE
jgi:hypothetical protein